MSGLEKKSMDKPDEAREVPGASLAIAEVGGTGFTLARNEPGWRWSDSLKELMGTESCEVPHTFYQLSGVLHVRLDDGTEEVFGPGDIGHIPPGHDAWVGGSEPSVAIHVDSGLAQAISEAGKG